MPTRMTNYRDYTYLIMPQPQRLSHWSLCRTPPASPDFKRSPSVPGPLRPVPHRRVGDTMVAAAASAAAPQAIFTWVDAQQIPANDRVSRRPAHAWLADLREMLGHKGLSEYNLSTGALRGALWCGYLANHHLARQIIGDGIFLFEVRTLGGWDATCRRTVWTWLGGSMARTCACTPAASKTRCPSTATWRTGCPRKGPPPRLQPLPCREA